MTTEEIRKQLFDMADESYGDFQRKLCPDAGHPMLGVRLPILRKLARTIAGGDWMTFWTEGPEDCQEEIQLKGLTLAYAKMPLEKKLPLIREFVKKIDSWAVCDAFCVTWKVKEKELPAVWDFILPYTQAAGEYEVRFGAVMMLDCFMLEEYEEQVLQALDQVRHEGYYARMAVAWTLAEMGIRFPDRTMAYLKGEHHLDDFTWRKTLQKMRESYRVPPLRKLELKEMAAMGCRSGAGPR